MTVIEMRYSQIPAWWWAFIDSIELLNTSHYYMDKLNTVLLTDYGANITVDEVNSIYFIEFNTVEGYTEFILRWR